MNATNTIKNTIIIALSLTTVIGIAQTVDARRDADSARNDTQNAKTAIAELRKTANAKQIDPYKLTPCTTDDYTQHNCLWKATDRGNDRGMTYMVDNHGFAWYRDDEILGEMIGWSDQD